MAKTDKPVALVTGASSGMGEDIANRLLKEGYEVYAGARRVDRMAGIEKAGGRAFALDVTVDQSMVDAVAMIMDQSGRLDVLVNAAGYGQYVSMAE